MKPNTILAILVITAGIATIVYQGFSYTTRERVVDIGSLHVMADKTRSIPLSPILGVLAVAGGVALLALGTRKS